MHIHTYAYMLIQHTSVFNITNIPKSKRVNGVDFENIIIYNETKCSRVDDEKTSYIGKDIFSLFSY